MVWFDAHGESTTPETTTSGFLDGMGIGILTGQCWHRLGLGIPEFEPVSGRRILLVGSRDLEPEECALLDRIGVTRVTAIGDLKPHHFDLDVLDPAVAVWNQWASPGGLSIEALTQAVGMIQAHTKIKGLGIASYDPELDHDNRALSAACSIVKLVLPASPA